MQVLSQERSQVKELFLHAHLTVTCPHLNPSSSGSPLPLESKFLTKACKLPLTSWLTPLPSHFPSYTLARYSGPPLQASAHTDPYSLVDLTHPPPDPACPTLLSTFSLGSLSTLGPHHNGWKIVFSVVRPPGLPLEA
jgi:hypothetical protein